MRRILSGFSLLFLINFSEINCLNTLKSDIKRVFNSGNNLSMSHGFFGVKSIILLQKYCKASDKKIKELLKDHVLWNLLKINAKFEIDLSSKKSFTFSIKPFNFDYGPYFIPIGCIDTYPGHSCILRRVGCCGVGFGLDFYYNTTTSKYKFSQNLSFFINFLAKKVIPFDLILSYSPFIFSINKGLYLELNLINFSFGNFIKALIMSFVDIENHYKPNWDLSNNDGSNTKLVKMRYKNKVATIQSVNKEKVKFLLLDNLLMSIVYNIRIFVGVKI